MMSEQLRDSVVVTHGTNARVKAGALRRLRNAVSLATILSITAGSIAQAAECGALQNDVSSALSALQARQAEDSKGGRDDFTATTSSSYSQKIYDAFETLNKNAAQAADLTNQAYNLSGNIGLMSEGQIQKKMPPVVPITMGNAVALAQAAADADNTKLDVAQLRCDQNTEDAALGAFLAQADGATQTAYRDTKREACKIVHVLAELQDARQKLTDIRQNGYPIFYLHESDKKKFAGKYSRTVQLKVDLRMYPTYPDSVDVNGEDQGLLLGSIDGIKLSYNSYFKWSDDNWTKLNLFQQIMGDSRKGDDFHCIPPKISLGSATVELCVKIDDVNDSSLTVYAKAKFRYHSDTHSIGLGSAKIPAPFGYLAKVSDMKEKKMQDLQSKFVKRIAGLLGVHSDLLDKAGQWKNTCS